MKIFISYAREDHLFAKKIYSDLKYFGLEPWLDTEKLLPGQSWKNTIIQEIKSSSYFLALLSSKSVSKRGFIQKELKSALDFFEEFSQSEIYLIPIRLEDCKPTDYKLQDIHWVDFFPVYYDGLKKLLNSLKINLNDYQKLKLENEILKENLSLINNKNKQFFSNYFAPSDDVQVIEEIQCEGILVDLFVVDLEKLIEMPKERGWIYELDDIVIKIYPNEITLEFKAFVTHPENKTIEVYKSYGRGLFTGEKGFLTYRFEEINKGNPNWEGGLVLRVPRRGNIHGFWLTTGVNEDMGFPIGKIILKRKMVTNG